MKPVRKAVFPVAGLGTRFLPATKAQPKEMLPIIDKPLIQFAVEEALEAGITHLILVIGRTKRAIADHFDANPELDTILRAKGQHEMADYLANIVPKHACAIYLRQAEALGLGHAVACAAPLIDADEPFAVLLADDLMEGPTPVLTQMMAAHARTGHSILAVNPVQPSQVGSYGIVDAPPIRVGGSALIRGIVEKPAPGEAPSTQAVVGRYILDGSIMQVLKQQKPGRGGEIQLTDAIRTLIDTTGVEAYRYLGHRYDCGSKMGYIEATLVHALRHPEFGPQARDLLASLSPHGERIHVPE
ncbi:UTP--glucose-1-phosphate uridylyltransferase GalU [Paracoccaceae bacterium Fryx2]|nr:UTP--glucose-1-phosphate uridylyltransferase GalU [Paracoccaceae bacterium Fryx2]